MGKEWDVLPTHDKVVALTFDGGAGAQGVPSILATLTERKAPATFFLTGVFANAHPGLAAKIGRSYAVGNHSMTHPDFTKLTSAQIKAQIRRAQRVIVRTTGHDPRPLFRFPFFDSNKRVIRAINNLGYGSIRAIAQSPGFLGTSGGESVNAVIRRIMSHLCRGAIVMMHVGANPNDGSTLDADALPRLIRSIRSRGFELVSVADYV